MFSFRIVKYYHKMALLLDSSGKCVSTIVTLTQLHYT